MPHGTPPFFFDSAGAIEPEQIIFGRSDVMQGVRRKVERVADANVPVLILGESGTGKEVLARLIHRKSVWREGPFVKVNCPAIPAELLESELFGYEKGAFTGAIGSKPGWVEHADRGTLFLDEVAELAPAMQAKLLQLLQDGQFSRIGGQEDRQVEVRVICATNRQLEEEVEVGRFRKDLYYRINVVSLQLPPLRERREDIPELSTYLLSVYSDEYNCKTFPLSEHLLQLLLKYDWPGNIRELENLIKRYVILGSEDGVFTELTRHEEDDTGSPLVVDGSTSLKSLTRRAVRDLERKIILEVLKDNNWNRKDAARSLKISYRALFYKMKEAGLPGKRVLPARHPNAVAGERKRNQTEKQDKDYGGETDKQSSGR